MLGADQVFQRRLADCDLVAGAYEMLAADYDWMFDDGELANGRAINHPAVARLLQRISRASVILDAACGTGVDAAVLARRGFASVGGRRQRGDGRGCGGPVPAGGLAIPLLRSGWADLPAATGERFDVVLCVGNSLVHAAGRDAMVQALTGLRRMARPGDTWWLIPVTGRSSTPSGRSFRWPTGW